MSELPVLSVIVPCLNEEENISKTTNRLIEIINDLVKNNEISNKSFIFASSSKFRYSSIDIKFSFSLYLKTKFIILISLVKSYHLLIYINIKNQICYLLILFVKWYNT